MRQFWHIKMIILALFLLCSIQEMIAANSIIYGVVMDSKTEEVLPGANITIEGTVIGASSDLNGEFYIPNVPVGKHTVVVGYIGYKEHRIEIEISEGEKRALNINLEFSALDLDQTIVVTAQAEGQMAAINQQISSRSIVNVVSSDKIQDIPDANAAESVGRLPGVAILRSGGEGTHVIIRGMEPKFNTIQINGVKLPSTEGGERSTNLSMLSPYMLEGIEVQKAITADQDADAMGGNVGFKIRKAQDGFKADIITQGGYNQLRNSYKDNKFVGSVSNRFFENKLGVFTQIDIENRNRSTQSIGVGYYVPSVVIGEKNLVEIRSLNHNDIFREKQRYGGTFVIDYDIPDGNIALTNMINSAKTDETNYHDNFSVGNRLRNLGGADGENTLTTLLDVLEYDQNFGPFHIYSNLSYTFSENNTPENINWGAEEPSAFTDGIDLYAPPEELYAHLVDNLENTKLRYIDSYLYYNKETALALKTELQYKLALGSNISGTFILGGKYRGQGRNYNYQEYIAPQDGFRFPHSPPFKKEIWHYLMGGPSPYDTWTDFPYTFFVKNSKSTSFLDDKYRFGPKADKDLMWDVARISTLGGKGDTCIMNSTVQDYSGTERYEAGYFMLDFKYGSLIQFIPGLRYEYMNTEYNGTKGNAVGYKDVPYPHEKMISKRTNEFWLPNMHLRVKPLDWFDIRLAYTQTLNRPDYTWLVPTMVIDVQHKSLSAYNATINPALSENYDLYLSVYEDHVGLFTAGAFNKKIHDFIFQNTQITLTEPERYGLPSKYENYSISDLPVNNSEMVDLWGVELDWQTNFWYLRGLLRGLVFNINYTHIFSKSYYPITETVTEWGEDEWGFPIQITSLINYTYQDRLINQPDDIVNVGLGYDFSGFSARFSFQYISNVFKHSDILPERRMSSDDYWRWDLSLKQDLPMLVPGLNLFMNVNNISAAHDIVLLRGNKYPTSDEFYGMTMDLGLRYRF